jgi:hypothetical protein
MGEGEEADKVSERPARDGDESDGRSCQFSAMNHATAINMRNTMTMKP